MTEANQEQHDILCNPQKSTGAAMTDETILLQENIFPVIRCTETRDNWEFYCTYCKTIHRHGKGEGHRVAHCTNQNSPYAQKGYYLKLKVKP